MKSLRLLTLEGLFRERVKTLLSELNSSAVTGRAAPDKREERVASILSFSSALLMTEGMEKPEDEAEAIDDMLKEKQ